MMAWCEVQKNRGQLSTECCCVVTFLLRPQMTSSTSMEPSATCVKVCCSLPTPAAASSAVSPSTSFAWNSSRAPV